MRGERGWKESIQRNDNWKHFKFGKRYTPIDSRSWTSPKQNNCKKLLPKHMIVKLLKAKDKEKVLKAVRKKWCFNYRIKNLVDSGCLIRNHGCQKEVSQHFFKVLQKKMSTQNLISNENILQKSVRNEGILRKWKIKGFVSRPNLWLKKVIWIKERMKEKNLKHQKGRGNNGKSKT